MSKKLQGEIEKCVREAQLNMQIYDVKWRELKSYNEASANPDWATLGSGKIRAEAPELLQLTCLRSRSHRGSSAANHPEYITVDVSTMTERQVAEVKEKLKTELEMLMKKVYRYRQQMMDWITHADLRQTSFTKEDLLEAKKEIESRHRKGKIYYLRGVSSEDTTNEQASLLQDAYNWMQIYIDLMQNKTDILTSEIETFQRQQKGGKSVAKKGSSLESNSRYQTLLAAVECYTGHAERLDDCLRKLRNNALSIDDVNEVLDKVNELKEILEPLVEGNDDLCYLVALDIYDDLCPAQGSSGGGGSQTPTTPQSQRFGDLSPPGIPLPAVPASTPTTSQAPNMPAAQLVDSSHKSPTTAEKNALEKSAALDKQRPLPSPAVNSSSIIRPPSAAGPSYRQVLVQTKANGSLRNQTESARNPAGRVHDPLDPDLREPGDVRDVAELNNLPGPGLAPNAGLGPNDGRGLEVAQLPTSLQSATATDARLLSDLRPFRTDYHRGGYNTGGDFRIPGGEDHRTDYRTTAADVHKRLSALRREVPEWVSRSNVQLCQGVAGEWWNPALLVNVSPSEQQRLLAVLETTLADPLLDPHRAGTSRPFAASNVLPVLVWEGALPVVSSIASWSGDAVDGQRVMADRSLILRFERGTRIEVLATSDAWNYGRLVDSPQVQGWFPASYVTRQRR